VAQSGGGAGDGDGHGHGPATALAPTLASRQQHAPEEGRHGRDKGKEKHDQKGASGPHPGQPQRPATSANDGAHGAPEKGAKGVYGERAVGTRDAARKSGLMLRASYSIVVRSSDDPTGVQCVLAVPNPLISDKVRAALATAASGGPGDDRRRKNKDTDRGAASHGVIITSIVDGAHAVSSGIRAVVHPRQKTSAQRAQHIKSRALLRWLSDPRVMQMRFSPSHDAHHAAPPTLPAMWSSSCSPQQYAPRQRAFEITHVYWLRC